MIHWLVQSADSYPSNPGGVVLDGVLHPREQARLATLKTEKRRMDWLLGRWTAKQLIGEVVVNQTGEKLPFDSIEVRNGAMGDPVVNCQIAADRWSRVNGQWSTDDPQSLISNLQSLVTLSISHSNNHAFCALVEKTEWPLGADIERIEGRSAEFVTDYFTKEEQALVNSVSDDMRDVVVTAVWSAKEAVLKALHLGLTVDTRSVACLIEPVAERPLIWTPFIVHCDDTRLPQAVPPLTGWWQTYENFVLTLVIQKE